jgi:hypothetical protein
MIFQRNEASGSDSWSERKRYFGAYIPLESTINLKLSMGQMTNRTYNGASNNVNAYLQIEPVQLGTYHSQSKPYYLYNDAFLLESYQYMLLLELTILLSLTTLVPFRVLK